MSPEGSVDVVHLWKRFRADRQRRLLREKVQHLRSVVGGAQRRGWRWALSDVEFHIEPGEAVGLVGTNGSGKSTLLKIMTQVMYPHSGRVAVSGRIGALIEVRAGIHPQLTGRENIFLYGALLGLDRRSIARRFDDIIEFAQLEESVDRLVKFYSSGMQMRLGFAVAAYLEPDVLLVDEVLAVGDTAFQQRCIDRMREVLDAGTTLVFVSHDLAAVEAVSARGIWLSEGRIHRDGPIRDVLAAYREHVEETAALRPSMSGLVRLTKAEVCSCKHLTPHTQEPLTIRLTLESDRTYSGSLCIGISEGPAMPVFAVSHDLSVAPGETEVECHIDRLPLPRSRAFLWVALFSGGRELLGWHPAAHFDVFGPDLDPTPRGIVRLSPVHVPAKWQVEAL